MVSSLLNIFECSNSAVENGIGFVAKCLNTLLDRVDYTYELHPEEMGSNMTQHQMVAAHMLEASGMGPPIHIFYR